MPKVFIPTSEMVPDKGLFGNKGVLFAFNLMPKFGGLIPVPSPAIMRTFDGTGFPLGMNYVGGGSLAVALADSSAGYPTITNLLLIKDFLAGTPLNVTRDPDTYGNYEPGVPWRFISFGKWLVATNGVNSIQRLDLTETSPQFVPNNVTTPPGTSTIPTGNPRAKYLATLKNHLVLLNISMEEGYEEGNAGSPPPTWPFGGTYGGLDKDENHGDVLWISALDDPAVFADPETHPNVILSDYQKLMDEFGEITGGVGGEDLYVFKSGSIYRVDGPPYTTARVSQTNGTIFSRSIVRIGPDVYFWGKTGPAKINGSEVTEFSVGRIEQFLKHMISDYVPWNYLSDSFVWDENTPDEFGFGMREAQCAAVALPEEGIVKWYLYAEKIPNEVGEAPVPRWDVMPPVELIYNYVEDRFSFSVNDQMYEITGGTTVTKSNRAVVFPCSISDGTFETGPGGDRQVGLDYTLKPDATEDEVGLVYMKRNQNKPHVVLFPFIQLDENNETVIQRVRPIFETEQAGWTGTGYPPISMYISTSSHGNAGVSALAGRSNASRQFPFLDGGLRFVSAPGTRKGWINNPHLVAGDFHMIALILGPETSVEKNGTLLAMHSMTQVEKIIGIEIQFKVVINKAL